MYILFSKKLLCSQQKRGTVQDFIGQIQVFEEINLARFEVSYPSSLVSHIFLGTTVLCTQAPKHLVQVAAQQATFQLGQDHKTPSL